MFFLMNKDNTQRRYIQKNFKYLSVNPPSLWFHPCSYFFQCGPPSSKFIPLAITIIVSIINQSFWGYVHQFSYRKQAPHVLCRYFIFINEWSIKYFVDLRSSIKNKVIQPYELSFPSLWLNRCYCCYLWIFHMELSWNRSTPSYHPL